MELRLVRGKKGAWGIVPSKVTLILPLLYLGFSSSIWIAHQGSTALFPVGDLKSIVL